MTGMPPVILLNGKTIATIVGIIVVIGIIVALPMKPGDVVPSIIDEGKVNESATIGIKSTAKDEPQLNETSVIEPIKEGLSVYITENGSKQYFLTAEDKPKTDEP